jgi:uncharacterized protein YciW
MLKAFCHDQIKLLLERMDSHPEEFIHDTKWNPYLPNTHHVTKGTIDYFPILNFAERNAIARKFNKLCLENMRQNAYNRVLEKMFEDPSKGQERMRIDAAGNVGIGASTITLNPYTQNTANTITVGNQTLTAADIARLKKHKTLFGRLFV